MHEPEPRVRGLGAIEEARRKRGRAEGAVPGRFWPWVLGALAVWAVVYWYVTDTQLERARRDLLERQRVEAARVGPKYSALQAKVNGWVMDAAGGWKGDLVTEEARESRFRERPGVYLRLHIDDAHDAESIAAGAEESLRDGFTSCFVRGTSPDPFAGRSCRANHECGAGQHCNQEQHCSAPAQPYNLRVASRGVRLLSQDFAREVAIAGDDMRLRFLDQEFRAAEADDLPMAEDLLDRAEYLLLVLDEPAKGQIDVPEGKTKSEALQAYSHRVRVVVYGLASGAQLLRVREQVAADVGVVTSDSEIAASVKRQANNCALALAVAERLGDVVAAAP